MTTVHLVRHGETVWHDGNRYAGRSDVPLTPRGVAQAGELATWAAGASLDRIVSSPLQRAAATAGSAARATGLVLEIEPRLIEADFGDAEGLTAAEMSDRFPEARRAFEACPATSPLPGAESGEHIAARALAALDDLCEEPDATVLVVAHTTLIRLALCALLGIDLDDYRRAFPRLDNVAVTTLVVDPPGRAGLVRYNVPPVVLPR